LNLRSLLRLLKSNFSYLVWSFVLFSLGLFLLSLVQLIDLSSDLLLFLHFSFQLLLLFLFFSLFLLIQLNSQYFLLFRYSLSFLFFFVSHLKTHDSCRGRLRFSSSGIRLRGRRSYLIVIILVNRILGFSWINSLLVLAESRGITGFFFYLILQVFNEFVSISKSVHFILLIRFSDVVNCTDIILSIVRSLLCLLWTPSSLLILSSKFSLWIWMSWNSISKWFLNLSICRLYLCLPSLISLRHRKSIESIKLLLRGKPNCSLVRGRSSLRGGNTFFKSSAFPDLVSFWVSRVKLNLYSSLSALTSVHI